MTLFENPFENPTSGFASFSTSDQFYLNVDPQCWNNVDQTLKCWLGLLLKSTSRKLLFHVKNADFQPPDTVKNYFTGAFQAFYTRSRSSHSKAFIYSKSQKTICEGVTLSWSCEMPTCKLTKKNSFTHPPLCILPSFSQNRGFESLRAQFLSGNVNGK